MNELHWKIRQVEVDFAIYICSSLNYRYPTCVKLYGRDHPYMFTASHLGQEIHQMTSIEHDANVKRIQFIDKSTIIEPSP